MKKSLLIIGCATLLLATACKNKNDMDNPFFGEWNTPYGIPDNDPKISRGEPTEGRAPQLPVAVAWPGFSVDRLGIVSSQPSVFPPRPDTRVFGSWHL